MGHFYQNASNLMLLSNAGRQDINEIFNLQFLSGFGLDLI